MVNSKDTPSSEARYESVPLYNNNQVASFDIDVSHHSAAPRASWFHAAFHTLCAVIGAGVLGLPYAFSILGWAVGLIALTTLLATSLYTSYLLSNLHEIGPLDYYTGNERRRLNTYRAIGEYIWGPKWGTLAVAPVQFSLMIGLCVTYSVTAGQSLRGVADSQCDGAECGFTSGGLTPWIIAFGIIQLALSQVPDFHSLWWVSLLGGLMSIGYCSIAAGASWAHTGSAAPAAATTGNTTGSEAAAPGGGGGGGGEESVGIFAFFNALGGIAFTFGGQAVLPEIQATLHRPPSTAYSMMKGIMASYVVVILTYFSVAISGYAAFGSSVDADVLLSIEDPGWLISIANIMVVLHVAAGYQVFAMPVFESIETKMKTFIRRAFVLRLLVRSLYVLATTCVACLLPFFGDLMGLIASIGLVPVTFILPPLMWLSLEKRSGIEFYSNVVIISMSVILAVLAFIGSTYNIVVDAKDYAVG